MIASFDIHQNDVRGDYEVIYQKLAFQVFYCPNCTTINFFAITFLKFNKQAELKDIHIKVFLT